MIGRCNKCVVKLTLDLDEQLKDKSIQLKELRKKYFDLCDDIRNLERENALLKKMFDDAENTQVIKYNGKLFRITETSHFTFEDGPDTLSVDAVDVPSEVK